LITTPWGGTNETRLPPGPEPCKWPTAGPSLSLTTMANKPLKPKHLRKALTDDRLLPKPNRSGRGRGKKRPKVMDAAEANRLFAATLRTRDQQQRVLAPDEAQLKRYGLPLWRTEADVARALGVGVKELRSFSIHRNAERVCHYVTFAVPKRSGGTRL